MIFASGVRAATFLIALASSACAQSAAGTPDELAATPLPLSEQEPAGTLLGALVFKGALHLTSTDSRFGGLSGLAIDTAGHLVAVSDRGFFLDADLIEGPDGTLLGLDRAQFRPMLDSAGRPFSPTDGDAEDVAIDAEGRRVVVFERHVRLEWFDPATSRALRSAPLTGFGAGNRAVEALARLGDRGWLMIAETEGSESRLRHVWVGTPGRWQQTAYAVNPGHDVAGAAALANGDVLVIERAAGLAGFDIRLTRVAAPAGRRESPLEGEEMLHLAPPRLVDNFEGVAVRVRNGRTAVYLVSDNNHSFLQRTLLLKFELVE